MFEIAAKRPRVSSLLKPQITTGEVCNIAHLHQKLVATVKKVKVGGGDLYGKASSGGRWAQEEAH